MLLPLFKHTASSSTSLSSCWRSFPHTHNSSGTVTGQGRSLFIECNYLAPCLPVFILLHFSPNVIHSTITKVVKRASMAWEIMGTFLSSTILICLCLSCTIESEKIDSSVHSHHMPKDFSGLEKRQAQYIINPCPEIFDGNPPQYCSQAACGGDTKKRGICDNIRLNGLQERRCQFDGGCGTYCRCRPDEYTNGPSSTVQYIGIFCAES